MSLEHEHNEQESIDQLADLLALAHVRLRKRRIVSEMHKEGEELLANEDERAITDKRAVIFKESSLENG